MLSRMHLQPHTSPKPQNKIRKGKNKHVFGTFFFNRVKFRGFFYGHIRMLQLSPVTPAVNTAQSKTFKYQFQGDSLGDGTLHTEGLVFWTVSIDSC